MSSPFLATSILHLCGITLTTSAILMSSVQAIFQRTHYCVRRFTLPGNVLEITMQAAQSEMSAVSHVKQSTLSHATVFKNV